MNDLRGWWTEERIARLKQLRRDGLSTAGCAEALGTTKNSVCGKLWRLRKNKPFSPELFTEQVKIANAHPTPRRTDDKGNS